MKLKSNLHRWPVSFVLLGLMLPAGLLFAMTQGRLLKQPADSATPVAPSIPSGAPAVTARKAAPPVPEPAQSGGDYVMTESIIPGGGGRSTSGITRVTGVIGHGATGISSGGQYSISSGFPAAVAEVIPDILNFSARAQAGAVQLSTEAGAAWTAISNVPWVTMTDSGGSGSAMIGFTLEANPGAVRSGTLTIADLTVTVRQGANFADVAAQNPFYEFIGKLSASGVTSGCGFTEQGQPLYCPSAIVSREQMAVFIIRSSGQFNPPMPAMQRFTDVPPGNPFYAFIEEMAVRGITSGCGVGIYCPTAAVSREQMAIFIIRATGQFNPPTPAMQRFMDVPPENPFYRFIEEMAVRGITSGCGVGIYCPGAVVTREQMAVFLVRAFGL